MSIYDAIKNFSLDPRAKAEVLQARLDAWVNEVTGFGTAADKTTYGQAAPSRRLSDIELTALYHFDDMAARMVDTVPDEMLREPFTVATGDVGLDADLKTKLDDLGVREKAADGERWGQLYGGGALIIGADDGRDAATPFNPDGVDRVRYLYVVDRRMLQPVSYYLTAGHPKFGLPETYLVLATGGPAAYSAVVHESRLVIFRGAPTGIQERAQLASWDYSVLQRPFEVLRQFNTGWRAVELMLTDGNQAVLKMTGLAKLIQSKSIDLLKKRLEVNELYRSVVRALVIDADGNESFERQAASFADIPATLEKFMLRLSAAVRIPVTILMGQSPAGMSATGDADFRWFYDRIRSRQTTYLEPRLRRIIDVILRSREFGGRRPEHYKVTFPPLWRTTPSEESSRRQSIATTDATYIQAGVLTPEEVALKRFTPDGFSDETILTDEERAARERVLADDLEAMRTGERPGADEREGAPDALKSAA